MRNSARITLGFVGAALLFGSTAVPAMAADDPADNTSSTDVTVTVEGGNLSIAAPAAVGIGLGNLTPGTTSAPLDVSVTVNDDRAVTAGWTAYVSMSSLSGTAAAAGTTIPASQATYTSNTATAETGTPGTITMATTGLGGTFSTGALTAQATESSTGSNGATWTAGLSIAVPANALAGTYTGVLTHSFL